LSDAIKRYAPSNENDPKSYANQIMKATGIDTSKTYASLSPEEQGKVLDAMKKIEGGRAGVVSGPNGGYQSKTSGLNPSASLPTATSSNAPATNTDSDTPAWLMSFNENLERQNRLQSEAVDALGRIRQNTAV